MLIALSDTCLINTACQDLNQLQNICHTFFFYKFQDLHNITFDSLPPFLILILKLSQKHKRWKYESEVWRNRVVSCAESAQNWSTSDMKANIK